MKITIIITPNRMNCTPPWSSSGLASCASIVSSS
jgi:hypothetical protein